jgi:hypothetical protein
MDDQLDQLAAEVQAAGISRSDFEAIVLRLSPQERRLFLLLSRGPADTVRVRSACSIGNPSEVRETLNRKLAAAGDRRRVVCAVQPHQNQYGEWGRLGRWSLTGASHAGRTAALA